MSSSAGAPSWRLWKRFTSRGMLCAPCWSPCWGPSRPSDSTGTARCRVLQYCHWRLNCSKGLAGHSPAAHRRCGEVGDVVRDGGAGPDSLGSFVSLRNQVGFGSGVLQVLAHISGRSPFAVEFLLLKCCVASPTFGLPAQNS